MGDYDFLMNNLRKVSYSKFTNLLTPEGWGVRIEGVHYVNPHKRVVTYFHSTLRDAYAVSNGRRMIVIPRHWEEFVEKDPNEVFFYINGTEHPYRLEWYMQAIPTAYLEWAVDLIATYLYPFDADVQHRVWCRRLWWDENSLVDVLIIHPRLDKFGRDGKPVFEKNFRIKESDASENTSGIVIPKYDDLFWDGEE